VRLLYDFKKEVIMDVVIKKCMECGTQIVNKEKDGVMIINRRCDACKLKFEEVY
jgi:hypothetical protein